MSPVSPNFSFLAQHDAMLFRYATQAERYLFDDPNTALFKIRVVSHGDPIGLAGNVTHSRVDQI
ncbi:MAG: hypothetical protein HQL63_13545 [Magnetococcales bacterium]|nr:hypothetical protein [Magnetococcales bacterium]